MDSAKLEIYENYYFSNELPVPFKTKYNGYTLYIYPIKVKDYFLYINSVNILTINKNAISNVEIIQMSYLQFLKEYVLSDGKNQQMLYNVLSLSLGDNNNYSYKVIKTKEGKVFLSILLDGNVVTQLNSKEFNQISEIILSYNDRSYDGVVMSEDLRKCMEDYYKLKFKDQAYPTLEEKKSFVSSKNGMTLKEINQMSYRYFDLIYNHCVSNDLYIANKIIQGSEKYKTETDVIHPLFKKRSSKYDFLQNAESFEKKVASAARS